ncbi:unnamed protein product [Phytomonas sp. Hart1]|nr:unnamed protein product [Phytomonas sp. Hart1]|eukprot:CCW66969.1 unnamed protein product [Phytomonas sp. isolate Hart1]
MSTFDEHVDLNGVGVSYSFLKGINLVRPPPTIVITSKDLNVMGNMERQYWEIKMKHFNIIIFFKKGKFYELYDNDAVVASREFGLKLVVDTSSRGKMRLAGVPEQSFSEWARLFVCRGYKVGRVEQLHEDNVGVSGVSCKAKVIRRELVEILTPGTVTDFAMLSGHKAIFVLAVSPALYHLGVIDCFAVDISRRVVHWCPCGNADGIQALRDGGGLSGSYQWGKVSDKVSQMEREHQERLWTEEALQTLLALLQQLDPQEVIIPGEASDIGEYSAVSHLNSLSDFLLTWIESEDYPVERISVSASLPPERACLGVNSPARMLMEAYFRLLRKEQEQSFLDEAQLYTAHLSTLRNIEVGTDVTDGERCGRVSSDTFGRESNLLSWERRYDHGLVLDACTVRNLEIVANLQDGSETHSLYQTLNYCLTSGGKRLFRTWVLRPASDATVIRKRQEVVRFLVEDGLYKEVWLNHFTVSVTTPPISQLSPFTSEKMSSWVSQRDLVSPNTSPGGSELSLPAYKRARSDLASSYSHFVNVDFERNLSRLAEMKIDQELSVSYVDPLVHYRKNLTIIATTVRAFRELMDWCHYFDSVCRKQRPTEKIPSLLSELLQKIQAATLTVSAIEGLFDQQSVKEAGMLIPSRGTSAEYDMAVDRLTSIEAKLHDVRLKAQQELFSNAMVTFTSLGKDQFLLEVASADTPKLTPRGLVERARGAKSVKYSMEALEPLVEMHREATVSKSAALYAVLRRVAAQVCEHFPTLYNASSALSYFDCLMSLANLWNCYPRMCFPQLVTPDCRNGIDSRPNVSGDFSRAGDLGQPTVGSAFLRASDLVHPTLVPENAVPNSVALDEEAGRLLVLTGPNMAGKSTLMRTIAVNVILAQMGGLILGSAMSFSPIHRIFTRIGARDASHKGQSTLYVELSETSEILRRANGQSLCLIDELGRGTSTHDGLAIAHASLQVLKEDIDPPPLTIFSTHYHALAFEQERCGCTVSLPSRNQGLSTFSCSVGSPDKIKNVQLGYMDFAFSNISSNILKQTSSLESSCESNKHHDGSADSCHTLLAPTFLYRLVSGICSRSYGVEVAVMAGVAPHIVHLAKCKSEELARFTALHEDIDRIRSFLNQQDIPGPKCAGHDSHNSDSKQLRD